MFGPTCQRAWRRRQRLPTGIGRLAASLIASAATASMLAACGSSSGSTNTAAGTSHTTITETAAQANTENQTSATTAATAPPPAIHVAGCRSVPAPAPRAGETPKPTEQLDPTRSYTVTLATNCGPIVIALAVHEAPKTTSSFAHLVQIGYYNDLTFHRVVPGFVIQGGDPAGNGTGGPSWSIVEPPPANLRYTKGVVAMAKGGTAPSGTSSSQFFIVTGTNAGLPPVYALVGHVIGSDRAVEAISRVPTEAPPAGGEASKPRAPMVIEKAMLSVH